MTVFRFLKNSFLSGPVCLISPEQAVLVIIGWQPFQQFVMTAVAFILRCTSVYITLWAYIGRL